MAILRPTRPPWQPAVGFASHVVCTGDVCAYCAIPMRRSIWCAPPASSPSWATARNRWRRTAPTAAAACEPGSACDALSQQWFAYAAPTSTRPSVDGKPARARPAFRVAGRLSCYTTPGVRGSAASSSPRRPRRKSSTSRQLAAETRYRGIAACHSSRSSAAGRAQRRRHRHAPTTTPRAVQRSAAEGQSSAVEHRSFETPRAQPARCRRACRRLCAGAGDRPVANLDVPAAAERRRTGIPIDDDCSLPVTVSGARRVVSTDLRILGNRPPFPGLLDELGFPGVRRRLKIADRSGVGLPITLRVSPLHP